jgi:chromate transporter
VNVLPGATAVQLGIFLGYARGGFLGGLLAGLCFAAPGLVVMLALTAAYATPGVSPVLRGALYGLGPVVLGIFIVALYRLGRTALRALPHRLIAGGAAAAALLSPLGTVAILLLTGGVGLFLFHGNRAGAVVLIVLAAVIALAPFVALPLVAAPAAAEQSPRLASVVGLFATIGAFTFGGGLSMIPLLEEHVVDRLQWLSPQEFIAGLALGQLTPGPVQIVAARSCEGRPRRRGGRRRARAVVPTSRTQSRPVPRRMGTKRRQRHEVDHS